MNTYLGAAIVSTWRIELSRRRWEVEAEAEAARSSYDQAETGEVMPGQSLSLRIGDGAGDVASGQKPETVQGEQPTVWD